MRRPSGTVIWMVCAYLGSIAIVGVTLSIFGTGQTATHIGLQLTARWSYCFFLAAYAGGALATVVGPVFLPIARRGRDLGLAFASAHFTHACLVAWLYYISPKPPVSTRAAIFFGTALVLTYLLALFSIPTLVARFPPRIWWTLRTFGMDFIAFAFLYDFVFVPFDHSLLHLIAYMPFVTLGSAAELVRLVAYAKRVRRWLTPPPTGEVRA